MWITTDSREAVKVERFFVFSVLHNALQKILWLRFLDRMSGDILQPLHQCLVLFQRDLHRLFFYTGPAETAKLQPFEKEKKFISFPYEPFYAVTVSTTEEKKISFSYGSSWKLNFTMEARPSIPRRKSEIRQRYKSFGFRLHYSAFRIPPIRERSASEAEFDISRTISPFRVTRSGWNTGFALRGDDGSLISVKETVP